jgi:1-phosphofructokinase family hexose kinase
MPDIVPPPIIAVALNPAIDRTLQVRNLELGGHQRGNLVAVQPAGKAVNVARVLGSLGTPAVLTGFVGEGDGPRFQRSFAGSPVRVALLEVSGRTRENITLVDPDRHLETHIRDVGFPVTPRDLARLIDVLASVMPPGARVIFSGSLPPGMDAAMFADLLAICRARGARVAVDSSGPGLEAVRRTEGLWLVKPNRAELAELAGQAVTSDDDVVAAAAAVRRHVGELAVTLGADGACLFSPEGAWRARLASTPPAAQGRIIKTVGSGDAFLAGLLHAHREGRQPADRLRLAVACGTASTFQPSAGQIDPADVAACLEKVEVTQLDGT